jgi:hypothetical protein
LQKGAILREAIDHSTHADPWERYHTTQNNCVLAIFGVLDRSIAVPWYRLPLV